MALTFTESAVLSCDLAINVDVAEGTAPELTLAEERTLIRTAELGVTLRLRRPTGENRHQRFDALQNIRQQ